MPSEKQTERAVDHPMEQILDVEAGTTMVTVADSEEKQLVPHKKYDEKDTEIEEELEEIRKTAYDAFEDQHDLAQDVDPKYAARNAEVAAAYLRTALDAVREKSVLKQHKDRLTQGVGKGKTVNNTLVLDRNQILKDLEEMDRQQAQENAVDAEFEEEDETTEDAT